MQLLMGLVQVCPSLLPTNQAAVPLYGFFCRITEYLEPSIQVITDAALSERSSTAHTWASMFGGQICAQEVCPRAVARS